MTDYIEREAVREALHNPMLMGMGFTEWELDRIPMADAEKVRHAKWNADGRCTACGGHAPFYSMSSAYYKSDYCFECGAKMDLEVSDG